MALISSQNPLALAFGIMGNIISLIVFFAPLPTFYQIYKKKTTGGFKSLPYVVSLFSAMLWLYYALIKTNAFLLITINSFGCVIQLIYILMYIAYAPKKARRSTLMLAGSMNVGLFSLILIVTYFAFSGSLRIQVLGWICVVMSVAVFAAPLSIVVQVIKTRSVEFMPFPLSLCLTFSAVMWFAYGFFQKDICVAIPNVLGFILGMLQMGLYGRYRKSENKALKEEEAEKSKVPEPLKNIVVLSTIGNAEVYPQNEEEGEAQNGDQKEKIGAKTEVDKDRKQCPV